MQLVGGVCLHSLAGKLAPIPIWGCLYHLLGYFLFPLCVGCRDCAELRRLYIVTAEEIVQPRGKMKTATEELVGNRLEDSLGGQYITQTFFHTRVLRKCKKQPLGMQNSL